MFTRESGSDKGSEKDAVNVVEGGSKGSERRQQRQQKKANEILKKKAKTAGTSVPRTVGSKRLPLETGRGGNWANKCLMALTRIAETSWQAATVPVFHVAHREN